MTAKDELATFILSMTPEETERALHRLDNPKWLNAHGFTPDDQEGFELLRTILQSRVHKQFRRN